MRGLFFSFEGIDGCGKSTQARKLCDHLKSERSFECVLVREPGGTPVGERIREILLDPSVDLPHRAELLLFLASRNVLTERVIKPALESGIFVVADRFADSSLAYQGYGRGLDIDFVDMGNEFATGGLKPDVVFYIDIPVDIAMERKKFSDRMEKENFLRRVREGYLRLARERGYVVIDGTKDVEEVWLNVKKVVDEVMEKWL